MDVQPITYRGRIVAALLAVGRGALAEGSIAGLLAGATPALDGAAAAAKGLCLRRVVLGRRQGDRDGKRTGLEEHETA